MSHVSMQINFKIWLQSSSKLIANLALYLLILNRLLFMASSLLSAPIFLI